MSKDTNPLPAEVHRFIEVLQAPPLLVAHLREVHANAVALMDTLRLAYPRFEFDGQAVAFGAATHDLGKALHTKELTRPGRLHEKNGPKLLEKLGVPPELSRFARTHGAWPMDTNLPIEDLLVILADALRKGRLHDLEALVAHKVALAVGKEEWMVFLEIDALCNTLADANQRIE